MNQSLPMKTMINYQLGYLEDLARMNVFQLLLPRLFFGLYSVMWNQHDQLPKRRNHEENHVLIPILQIIRIVKAVGESNLNLFWKSG